MDCTPDQRQTAHRPRGWGSRFSSSMDTLISSWIMKTMPHYCYLEYFEPPSPSLCSLIITPEADRAVSVQFVQHAMMCMVVLRLALPPYFRITSLRHTVSLVPRRSFPVLINCVGGKESLVHTVCACAKNLLK